MKKVRILLWSIMISIALCGCACSTCEGTQVIDCDNCDYHGEAYCESCGGVTLINSVLCEECDGEKYKLVDCSTCDGRGYVVNPITWEKFRCGACDGKMYEKDYCDLCKGKGRLGDDCEECWDGTVDCPVCEGKSYLVCPDCKDE